MWKPLHAFIFSFVFYLFIFLFGMVEEHVTSMCPCPFHFWNQTCLFDIVYICTSLNNLSQELSMKNNSWSQFLFFLSKTLNPLCVAASCSHLFFRVALGVDLVFLAAYLRYKLASSSLLLFCSVLPTAYLYCPQLTPLTFNSHALHCPSSLILAVGVCVEGSGESGS